MIPYGEEIQDHTEVEVNEDYIEALDNYIGAKLVVSGKDSIPVISGLKRRKRDASVKLIGEEHSNLILNTRVYYLEFPGGRVDDYGLKIVIENLIYQVDNQLFCWFWSCRR